MDAQFVTAATRARTAVVFFLAGFLCLTGSLSAQSPLLSQVVKNVNATADVTVDVTLPPAPPNFNLTGTVNGTATFFLSVNAQSSDGSGFSGSIDPITHKYLVMLPAGTYRLSVSFLALSGTISAYQDPTPIQINADATRDITVPDTVAHQVSGVISGMDSRFPSRFLSLYSTDATGVVSFIPAGAKIGTDGRYKVAVQDGTYSVFLLLAREGPSQGVSLGLGSVTVNGADTQADFTVPATANLTGVVRMADSSPLPAKALMFGIEGNPFLLSNAKTLQTFGYGMSEIDTASGSYQLVLATGHKYTVAVSVPVLPEQAPQSSGTLGVVVMTDTQFDGDTTRDVTIPSIPGTATITGKVTDSAGVPVAGASVDAASAEVTNISAGGFSRNTQTDANGIYSLVVLTGTNYVLTITPPFVITQ